MALLSVWSEVQIFAYGQADATATPSSLAPVISRMVYLSGATLPSLSWNKARVVVVVVVVVAAAAAAAAVVVAAVVSSSITEKVRNQMMLCFPTSPI